MWSSSISFAATALAVLMSGCCMQGSKPPAPKVSLADVLNEARTQFAAIPNYAVDLKGDSGKQLCAVKLTASNLTLAITLKTVAADEAKGSATAGPSIIQAGPEFDHTRTSTGEMSITWHKKQLSDEVQLPVVFEQPKALGQRGDTEGTLPQLVWFALRAFVNSNHDEPCVVPENLKIHTAAQVTDVVGGKVSLKFVLWSGGLEETHKDDSTQDFVLTLAFKDSSSGIY